MNLYSCAAVSDILNLSKEVIHRGICDNKEPLGSHCVENESGTYLTFAGIGILRGILRKNIVQFNSKKRESVYDDSAEILELKWKIHSLERELAELRKSPAQEGFFKRMFKSVTFNSECSY